MELGERSRPPVSSVERDLIACQKGAAGQPTLPLWRPKNQRCQLVPHEAKKRLTPMEAKKKGDADESFRRSAGPGKGKGAVPDKGGLVEPGCVPRGGRMAWQGARPRRKRPAPGGTALEKKKTLLSMNPKDLAPGGREEVEGDETAEHHREEVL